MVNKPNPIPRELKDYLLKTLPKDLVERLVEFIHDGWWEEKIKQGFHHPSEVHKEWDQEHPVKYCDKCHLDMVPYPELPSTSKILDKIAVETVLVGLYTLGYDLTRNIKDEKFNIDKWKRDHNIE
jgi:hypothetical protein